MVHQIRARLESELFVFSNFSMHSMVRCPFCLVIFLSGSPVFFFFVIAFQFTYTWMQFARFCKHVRAKPRWTEIRHNFHSVDFICVIWTFISFRNSCRHWFLHLACCRTPSLNLTIHLLFSRAFDVILRQFWAQIIANENWRVGLRHYCTREC